MTKFIVGDRYNWFYQTDMLVYLGKSGCWHQFAKVESPDVIWCEVLDEDLHMIERSK